MTEISDTESANPQGRARRRRAAPHRYAARLARRFALPLMVWVSCGAVGCTLLEPQPDPTQFFVLTASVPTSSGETTAKDFLLGVGPITVPEYLDRTNIVRRFAPNRVAISELEWWAEPLETSLLRVLAENLAARLGTPAVLRYPWPLLVEPAYTVAVGFSRFDIVEPDRVRLSARWVVRGGEPRQALLTRESNIDKTTAGPTTADAVAALSQTLDDLSAEIATAIETVRAEAPAKKAARGQ